jgi:hypothetical protein
VSTPAGELGSFGDAYESEIACELYNGAGNCWQAADGRWYPVGALGTFLAPVNQPSTNWNPISWAESALSDLTEPVSVPIRWIIKQIVKLGSLISNDIEKVYGYLASRFGGVENTISHLAGQINSVVGTVGGDIDRALTSLRHDVAADVDAAVKPIARGLGDAEAGVGSILRDAEHYADTAVADFHRDVLTPAVNDINTALDDAQKVSAWVWQTFVPQAIAPVVHDASEAHVAASKAIYWIDHGGMDAVHLVEKCWDFLEWVAVNPIRALEELPAKLLPSLTTSVLEGKGTTVLGGFDGLVSELDKVYPDE